MNDSKLETFLLLEDIRSNGWRVAVHNDYQVAGEFMTFWLLTHPAGMYVKGEGKSDLEALTECTRVARQIFRPSP